MGRHTDTKKKIIDLGEKLLMGQGFNGFSYADIAVTLGMRNAAVHYHFPTKCDLGLAVIQRSRQRFARWAAGGKPGEMADRERLDSFFGIYRHYLTRSRSVCLSGALETDFTTLPPPMQDEARELVRDLLAWIETFLEEAQKRGSFSFPGSPRDQAVVVIAVMQGALQMTRVMDSSVFDSAISQVRRLLGA